MPTWGNISCLYPAIGYKNALVLEEVISVHERGKFKEAEMIILKKLPSSERFPVIAIALADIYESQGLFSPLESPQEALGNSSI